VSTSNPTGGAAHFGYKVRQFLMAQPGKRGIDIPEDRYDKLFDIAAGITQPLWGMFPTPQQMQHAHDNNLDTAEKMHQGLYGQLPHPKAPDLSVGEYGQWERALQTVKQHGK
jgi:hypothetical protein